MAKPSESLSSGREFFRKNWQIIYAVILIVLVPLTIVLNTLFVVNRFRTTVDVELQRTALIIGRMFNVSVLERMDDAEALQEQVLMVAQAVPEIRSLDVLTKEGEDFTVLASLYDDGIGRPAHGRQNILAWYDDQSIAYLTKSPRSAASDQKLTAEEVRGDQRYWGVVMPLHDAEGNIRYLLSAKISLEVMDQLVRSNLFWSYAWLAITLLIIVLILASNTRLFQYAVLFKRLKEVDKMKDDFISMASHELRAPITAIKGYLSLFLDGAFGELNDKATDIMKTTFAISNHLGSLVEDLLDVSRIEQGRMKFDFVETKVDGLIEEVIKQLHFEAEKKGLTFEFKKSETEMPEVKIDESRFKQVLINISSNAIKYTMEGSITVTTMVDEAGMLEVKVTDTGIGMNPEQREKLFTKFYRIRTDQTRDVPGTGLGLWITRRIVELMGGKIFVDSIEKVGTQVSVLLPVAKKGAAPGSEPETAEATDDESADEPQITVEEKPNEEEEQ